MELISASKVISTILRHDNKVTTYKIALLRAINDVVLFFPDLRNFNQPVVIPLRVLAEYWVAYYWVFVGNPPIAQGQFASTSSGNKSDISFRPLLTALRQQWEAEMGVVSRPADGFFLINELRLSRKRQVYSDKFLNLYQETLRKVAQAIENPIQYAGPEQWTVFTRPARYNQLTDAVVAVPGTKPNDKCLLIIPELWHGFRELSLWIEALCLHEWCLFTERKKQQGGDEPVDRGDVYRLLTDRPDNRRPLTWERNQVDLLLLEGYTFTCPWTEQPISQGVQYAMDHLVPVSVYPINELWNLIPSNPRFNSHNKRDRLPTTERLMGAKPHLELAYRLYDCSATLSPVLREDVAIRFTAIESSNYWHSLISAVVDLVDQVAESRSLTRF